MMQRLYSALIPLLLLTGCPESPAPSSDGPSGEGDGASAGSGGPSPFSNPNDARFSVAPGTGVKLSGSFNYSEGVPGSYRIDFQKRESANGPPMLVHTIELQAPGEWSLEVPKDYGPIFLTGFVDLKGDGPSPDDPVGRTTDPIIIGTESIEGVVLEVALGNDLGIPAPPQPGDNMPSTEPGAPGPEDAPEGAPGGDPAGGTPSGPADGPPSDGPPADGPPADEGAGGPPSDG